MIGLKLFTPLAPGATAVNCLSSNGVQMQPTMNGCPSGAVPEKADASGHCCEKASPTGVGWVADVFWNALCGTGFSSIWSSGLPSCALMTYIQPVLHASATAVEATPPYTVSYMNVGDGQS